MNARSALARFALALAALVAAASPLRAETFKWVDENGVVNYSNSPPAAHARQSVATVEDRVSTYESDPALRAGAAAKSGRDDAELEWLQRQRYMMETRLLEASAAACGDRAIGCDGAYLPDYPVYVPVAVFPRTHGARHHRPPVRHASRPGTRSTKFAEPQ